jgi:glycosyltransferase involved in cell wall biosynthesis
MVIISTHVQYFNEKPGFGTGENIAEYLHGKNIPLVFIKHSLYGDQNSRIEYISDKTPEIITMGIKRLPFIVRCIQDFIVSFFVINKINTLPIFVGINTFNAFIGLVLRKFGKVDKVIFYTAEYSLNRFNNKLFNKLYLSMDRYCARYSNEVWNPSTRIMEVRRKTKYHAAKQLFVPNTPSGQKPTTYKYTKIRKMILVGTLSRKAINFDLIFHTLQKLIVLHPYLRLFIVGSGPDELWIKSRIKDFNLTHNVVLLGYQTHDIVLKTIRKCDLGLAIYSGLESWTYYGDSMKIRDYLACGVPVVMTDTCSTADDIRNQKVGYIIKTSYQLYQVVNKLCNKKELYIKLQRNIRFYNKHVTLENILKKSSILHSVLIEKK